MKKQAIKTYKSCSDIPIYNFTMCVQNSDYSNLIINASKFTDSKICKFISENESDLENTFKEIKEEYAELTFNIKELRKRKELSTMMFLESRHNTIIKVVNLYLDTKEIFVLDILNELGIPFDKKKSIKKQLKNANNVAMGIRNMINIKNLNFRKKYRISDDEDKEDKSKDIQNIDKYLDAQALVLESNLETGYRIDIKKTTVLRWVNLLETNQIKLDKHNNN